MRKLFLAVTLLSSGFLFAQSPIAPGEAQLNAGVGLSSWGVPIYVGADFGIAQDISLGGVFSYRSYSENFAGSNFDWSLIVLGANGNYHFDNILDLPSDWNVYGGITLGYYIWSSSTSGYTGNRASGLGLDAQIGTRYFFSESFALNLELGGGTAAGGKLGITKKF
jgi:hypothetical protein